MGWLIIWVLCGIAAAMVASSKGRNGCGWFLMGFILGPFGLLFALFSGKEGPAEGERKCPFCAEYINEEAVVCKYCGKNLPKIEKYYREPTQGVELSNCPKCGVYAFDGVKCNNCKYNVS